MISKVKCISLLRGINVGGKRIIRMTDLKDLYATLGFTDCISYIQSGNVIFEYRVCSNTELEKKIEKAISTKYAFDVPVIVRTTKEWEQSVQANPYVGIHDNNSLYLSFLSEKPKKNLIKEFSEFKFESDSFQIINKDVFIYCSRPYHKTKLSNPFFESKLKIKATTRNWNTVLKLLALSAK